MTNIGQLMYVLEHDFMKDIYIYISRAVKNVHHKSAIECGSITGMREYVIEPQGREGADFLAGIGFTKSAGHAECVGRTAHRWSQWRTQCHRHHRL